MFNPYDDPEFDYREWLTEEEVERARSMTVDEIMEGGINDLIKMAYMNGMSDDRIDLVLRRVMNERARIRREKFKNL